MRQVAYLAGVSFRVAVLVGLALCGACSGSSPAPFEDRMAPPDSGPSSSSVNPSVDATTGATSNPPVDATTGAMSDTGATDSPAASVDTDSALTAGDADEASDAAGSNEAADAAGGCPKGCGPRQFCAYLIADACGAAATCVTPPPQSTCNAIVLEMACGCDGHTVHWDGGCKPALPDGYAPAPVTHTGACN
jgi:hypothetical protein